MIHDKFVIMEGQIQDPDGEDDDEEDEEGMETDDADENSPKTDGSNISSVHSEGEEENKDEDMSDRSEDEEESENFSISVKPEVRSLLYPFTPPLPVVFGPLIQMAHTHTPRSSPNVVR